MKKHIVIVGFMILCIGLFAGASYGAEKVIKMELSSFRPSTDKISVVLQEWCDEVGKRTNGRVKVTLHPGGTLTPPAQTFDSVMNDVVDIGEGPMGVTTGRFPLMEVLDLPLGLKSSQSASMLAMELIKKFKPKEFSKVKMLFMVSSPPAYFQTRKPIKTLEDLKGAKIRALGGTTTKVIRALGAVPVVLSPTDVYDALSKGVADGAVVISDALTTLKWGDVLHYTTMNVSTSFVNNGYMVMNLNKWKSLPPDIQQIIDKLSDEYVVKISKIWDQKEKDAIATLKSKGHTTITLSAAEEEKWAKRITPLYDEYVKEKSKRGIPAADVLTFCKDWAKKN